MPLMMLFTAASSTPILPFLKIINRNYFYLNIHKLFELFLLTIPGRRRVSWIPETVDRKNIFLHVSSGSWKTWVGRNINATKIEIWWKNWRLIKKKQNCSTPLDRLTLRINYKIDLPQIKNIWIAHFELTKHFPHSIFRFLRIRLGD